MFITGENAASSEVEYCSCSAPFILYKSIYTRKKESIIYFHESAEYFIGTIKCKCYKSLH